MCEFSLLPAPVLHGDSRMSPRYGWSHLSSINKQLTRHTGKWEGIQYYCNLVLSPTGQSAEPPIHGLLFIALFTHTSALSFAFTWLWLRLFPYFFLFNCLQRFIFIAFPLLFLSFTFSKVWLKQTCLHGESQRVALQHCSYQLDTSA